MPVAGVNQNAGYKRPGLAHTGFDGVNRTNFVPKNTIQITALDQYRWDSRILLLFSDATTDAPLALQHQLLRESAGGVRDRDLVVVTATEGAVEVEGVERTDLSADRLREAYGVPTHGFHALLIGKDGGVKLRSEQPIAAPPLFSLIDAMPMRQREMSARERCYGHD